MVIKSHKSILPIAGLWLRETFFLSSSIACVHLRGVAFVRVSQILPWLGARERVDWRKKWRSRQGAGRVFGVIFLDNVLALIWIFFERSFPRIFRGVCIRMQMRARNDGNSASREFVFSFERDGRFVAPAYLCRGVDGYLRSFLGRCFRILPITVRLGDCFFDLRTFVWLVMKRGAKSEVDFCRSC